MRKDYSNYILPLGVVAAIGFFIYRFFIDERGFGAARYTDEQSDNKISESTKNKVLEVPTIRDNAILLGVSKSLENAVNSWNFNVSSIYDLLIDKNGKALYLPDEIKKILVLFGENGYYKKPFNPFAKARLLKEWVTNDFDIKEVGYPQKLYNYLSKYQ